MIELAFLVSTQLGELLARLGEVLKDSLTQYSHLSDGGSVVGSPNSSLQSVQLPHK